MFLQCVYQVSTPSLAGQQSAPVHLAGLAWGERTIFDVQFEHVFQQLGPAAESRRAAGEGAARPEVQDLFQTLT